MIVDGLDHLTPEQFLVLGGDIQEVPIRVDSGSLWDGHGLEVHRSGTSAKKSGGGVACRGLKNTTGAGGAAVAVKFVIGVKRGYQGREV